MYFFRTFFAAIMQFHENQSPDLERNTRPLTYGSGARTMNVMPLKHLSLGNQI